MHKCVNNSTANLYHLEQFVSDFFPYSQKQLGFDPHLRKMEREAYTKGNLIFRDFEDLIKTGKIEVHIDFKNSGEPKMSLQE